MSRSQPHAKSTTQPKVGFFATLSNPLRGLGTSAPSRTRSLLAVLALAIAAFAVTAAPALAAPPSTTCCTTSDISYTSVHVTGTVTTDGSSGTTAWAVQYSTDQTTWSTGFSPSFGELISGSAADQTIEGTFSLPKGGTKYFLRVIAANGVFIADPENPEATSPAPNPSFTTLTADPTAVVTVDNASEIAYTTAKASGTIKRPVNSDNVACHFEYITDAAFNENLGNTAPGFQGANVTPCEPEESVAATGAAVPVEAKLNGLANGTTYHLRLAVSNAANSDTEEAPSTFTTLTVDPPSVVSIENASNVEYSRAQVEGFVVRPNASEDPALDITACNFEYVTDQQFNDNPTGEEFNGAGSSACDVQTPIHAEGPVEVKASLGSLAASTTYHLRLSATNAGGTGSKEAAATFTTLGPVPKPLVIKTDDATDVGKHSAKVSGEIQRPGGSGDPAFDTYCRFEYVTQAQFEAEEFAAAEPNGQRVDCIEAPLTSTAPDYPAVKAAVSAELTGLPSGPTGITYHLRLTATNGSGNVSKEAAGIFSTLAVIPPTGTVDSITEVGYTSFRVTGTADPGNQGVFPLFEYAPVGTEEWVRNSIGALPQLAANSAPTQMSLRFPIEVGGCDPESPRCTEPLKPGTTYQVRLSGRENEENTFVFPPGPYAEFTTKGTSTPPSTALQVTDVTGTSVHISAGVDAGAPAGPLDDEGKAAYRTDWHFECAPACPPGLHGGTVEAEEGSQAIELDVKHLEAKKHYEIKLIAHNSLATVESEVTFDTLSLAPTVTALPGGSDGEGGYILAGIVNPNNSKVTSCEFKWGPDSASYAFKADCSPPPGEKGQPVTVEAHLTGLNPGSVYHANLFATNAAGTEESKDFEFTSILAKKGDPCPNEELRRENDSLGLPECRAYEMTTDPNKQGAGAQLVDFSGGSAVRYVSAAPNLAGSGQGYVSGSTYVATRTAGGWKTIPNLNGPSGSMSSAPEFITFALPVAFSADLLTSVWGFDEKKDSPNGPYFRRPDGRFVLMGLERPFAFGLATVGASDDLSHFVADGGATGGQGGAWGPGVYEFVGTGNGQPRRVDIENLGDPVSASVCKFSGFAAQGNAVSSDGRVIVFTSLGGCGVDNPPANEVWARVDATTSYNLSASQCTRPDCNAPADAIFQGAATDGSRVYFTTTQQLMNGDTDQAADLYACDIPTTPQDPVDTANPCSALHQVSAAPGGTADVQQVLKISDDGSSAYFTSQAVLAGNEDALGEPALPGDRNLYVWRSDAAHPAGQTAFVARLPESDSLRAQATPDGRYLLLQTAGQLLPNDTDESTDIYRYDAGTEEMARVSTAVSGAGGNGNFDARLRGFVDLPAPEHNSHSSISDDGELIVFSTEEALSPLDGNGEPDAYLWNGGRVLGSVAPLVTGLSEGQTTAGQVFINGSGQDIYIQTAARLNPSDTDFAADVYDARVVGGFPQHQEGCAGETCQASGTPAPTRQTPSSEQPGSGNPPQPRPCPKGKVRNKKGKCVKKTHKRHSGKKSHGKKNKRAGSNGGGGN